MPGEVDPESQCTAHAKHSGERCKRSVVPGTTVCRYHGGLAPQVKAAAERRLELEAARQAMVTYGLPREVEPHEALVEELNRTAGHVTWLGWSVQLLDENEVADHRWTRLYQEERRHLADVAKTCIAAGVAERAVRLAEDQAQQLARIVSAILADLGHDLSDERTREIVRLRMLEGGREAA